MSQAEKIIQLIRHFGDDPISCALLQDRLEYIETSFGILAYRRVGDVDITLGPPLAADCDKKELINRFLAKSKKPVLNYLKKRDVQALSGIDLKTVCMGSDRWVDTSRFTQEPEVAVLSADLKATKAKLTLREIDINQANSYLKQIVHDINLGFLVRAKYNQEMSFINRPFDWSNDGMRRLFLLEKYDNEHQGIFGYVVLNPFYHRMQLQGYMLDIIRFDKTRLWGVWLAVVRRLAILLRKQNLSLSLGFCPLQRAGMEVKENGLLKAQMSVLSRFLSSVHYIERLAKRKSLVQGGNQNRYMMSYTSSCWPPMKALLAACDVHTPDLFSAELLRSILKGIRLQKSVAKAEQQKQSVPVS